MGTPRDRRLLVLCDAELDAYRSAFAEGLRTSALPYGMDRLEELGWQLAGPRYDARRLATALEHRTGLRIAGPVRARRTPARLTLAVLEHWAQVPALLHRVPLGGYRQPLVTIVCWAAEDLRHGSRLARRRALRALRASALVAYWSENQTQVFLDAGIRRDRLLALPFGTETTFFEGRVDADRTVDALAVGMDRGRDYATLAAAVRGTSLRVGVLARPENLAGLDLPPNLEPLGVLPPREYADLLRSTKVVVVPTRDLAYPSGQTVALDAAAAGSAVVVTGTTPMREYFTDGETASMPPPGDPAALRDAVQALLADDRARRALAERGQRHVLSRHDSARMWERLHEALTGLGIRDNSGPNGP